MAINLWKLRASGACAAFVAACVVATSPGFAAETLRVGKANGTSFVFGLVDLGAQAKIFEKHGLTLEISSFGGGPKLQQALAAGSVDLGISSGPDMAVIAKGAPVKAVAVVLNGLDQVLVTNPAGKIKTVDDLKGGTFAASSPASLSGWLPRELAKTKGWGADGIKLQMVSSQPSALALLETNQLDAMTLDPATALQGEKTGKLKIAYRFAQLFPKFPQYAVYATDDLIAKNPAAAKNFLAGWVETVAYARTNKDAAVGALASIIGVDNEIVAGVYDEVMPLISADGRFDPQAMDILLESFVSNGVLEKKPDAASLTNAALLP